MKHNEKNLTKLLMLILLCKYAQYELCKWAHGSAANFPYKWLVTKSNIFDNNSKQNRKRKFNFFILNSFEFSINVISEISGVLPLADFCIEDKKGRNNKWLVT